MLIGELALIAAVLFTGAAFYVSFAEHPARLLIDEESALAQWKQSYERAKIMQGVLALAGGGLAFYLWWTSLNWLWLIGALLLLANWPFTLIAIMRINQRLEAAVLGQVDPELRPLLERWGRLHAVRTALGAASAAAMLAALHCRI